MRCLASLARWDELNLLCKDYWARAEPVARLEMAPMVRIVILYIIIIIILLPQQGLTNKKSAGCKCSMEHG